MRVLVVLLCAVSVFTAGVAINHAYLAGRYAVAGAPERAFDLHSSSLTYGGVGIICLALALVLHVIGQGNRPVT
ncbi:hypothetical protein SAMN05216184_10313 [Georgenia satyanarayanai]|uniref:Uncharacterized protein n=1 Tax=Georgenia satyanarayanai TaxID=860221 RepID=A0A2Y9A5S9_9MICO|nr:hypothetical protein [Georgenia satyanarayanai]PYG00443.1 hypothetical protein A8987_10313 [Georgenia satyanarayanai]SSA39824.1 hypothetical protein SAMN05216184_10313 [Georgenia satyanarayanai]